MMTGCPIINAQQLERFKAINRFSDDDVRRLSQYCRKEVDTWQRG